MSDWRDLLLSDVADFSIGGTPSRNEPKFWATKPSGYPWIAISDLKNKFISETSEHISGQGALNSNVKAIEPHTTVMSFKLSIGRTAITDALMYCNEAIAFFNPDKTQLDYRWLYHALPRATKAVVTDTAVKGSTLNKKAIAKIPLYLPPIVQQAKIAEILDTLDAQIQKTEALIAKLEKIKEGLLHDLLTRGIDQNGQLRPTPEQAPELYKKSILGLIPKEWESTPLGLVTESMVDGPFGSNLKTSHYVEEAGVQVVRLQNIKTGKYDETFTAFISIAHAKRLDRNRVEGGDVLVAALGDETNKPGRACLYPKKLSPAINKADCFRVRAQPSKATNSFLMHSLNFDRSAKQATSKQQGVTLQRINLSNLRTVVIGLPSLPEQELISAQLNAIADKISTLKQEEQKLKATKHGLMDDLLTGRVRVTPLLKDAV